MMSALFVLGRERPVDAGEAEQIVGVLLDQSGGHGRVSPGAERYFRLRR